MYHIIQQPGKEIKLNKKEENPKHIHKMFLYKLSGNYGCVGWISQAYLQVEQMKKMTIRSVKRYENKMENNNNRKVRRNTQKRERMENDF